MPSATQIYTLVLAANQAQVLLVEGGFYKILSATGTVSVSREGGSIINPMRVGQGERLRFTRLTIKDVSGAANTVEVIIADESFIDDRISGEVSVIDGGKSRTLAGVAFLATIGCSAVAGQYAHCQLRNDFPSKNLIVESFSISSSAAFTVTLQRHGSFLANPYLASTTAKNKFLSGAASSLALSYYQNAAAPIPTGNVYGVYQGQAQSSLQVRLTTPYVLSPYQSLIWYVGNAVNTDLFVVAELYEEPV